MGRNLKTLDYGAMVNNSVIEDYRIGDDIILLKTYIIEPIEKFEYTASENMVIQVLEGDGNMSIDGETHQVKAPCLIFILEGQHIKTNIVHRAIQRSAIISDRFLEDLFLTELRFNNIKSFILDNPIVNITERTLYEMEVFCKVLIDITGYPNKGNNIICAKHLILTLFYGPLYDLFKKRNEMVTYRTPNIVNDFFKVLERHFKEEHSVDFYADKLCISARYLYSAVLSATGKTPSSWIDHYLFVEAKKLIDNNQMTILQISQVLNFSGLPSFSKFFKRLEGISPSEYRRSIFQS